MSMAANLLATRLDAALGRVQAYLTAEDLGAACKELDAARDLLEQLGEQL